jgi:hypothetical protein
MPSNSPDYQRAYMRRYRDARQCHGRDHAPAVELPRRAIEPATADEIAGAKQALAALHRLRAIGVRRTKKAP